MLDYLSRMLATPKIKLNNLKTLFRPQLHRIYLSQAKGYSCTIDEK